MSKSSIQLVVARIPHTRGDAPSSLHIRASTKDCDAAEAPAHPMAPGALDGVIAIMGGGEDALNAGEKVAGRLDLLISCPPRSLKAPMNVNAETASMADAFLKCF